jgi:hypothetical protein
MTCPITQLEEVRCCCRRCFYRNFRALAQEPTQSPPHDSPGGAGSTALTRSGPCAHLLSAWGAPEYGSLIRRWEQVGG